VSAAAPLLARRCDQRLAPDPSRVITRLFVPGQEGFEHQDSRASPVLDRFLALDDDDVQRCLDDVVARFAGRHRDLDGVLRLHADELSDRLDPACVLSPARRLVLGATFTSEFAIEGAALCNPSMVAAPDQRDAPPGGLRVVMSVRAIGEGHRSSIGFRTGVVDADGVPTIDPPAQLATCGRIVDAPMDAAVFRGEVQRMRRGGDDVDFVLDSLGDRFSAADLEQRLDRLGHQLSTRSHGQRTITLMRAIAARTYGIRFDAGTELAERVLWPAMSAESNGMEDARFVRFVDDDGSVTYRATYTAYDGADISQQLLETTDFVEFTSSPLVGPATANKGFALFPRRIGGRYVALSRFDRETNAVAFSDDPRRWGSAIPCQAPSRPWEVLQIGNCGSPIETEAGWLVLTHGVGPMRTYRIGAILLDLDDPTRIVGQLADPLLSPEPDDRDGYVPNVVYSCGALVHGETLVLPHGIGDAAIGLATVHLPDLIAALAP
jgi:predicted GH43/DUF377 family glycosyl hydrolase